MPYYVLEGRANRQGQIPELQPMEMTANELNTIQNALDILNKYLRTDATAFTDPAMVKSYLRLNMTLLEREQFVCLFLDSQHRLIAEESLFYGTIDASPVYPRVVVQKALKHNAAAIILAHNHPSGVGEPSRADRSITERLIQALALVDIRVLDHLVVGSDVVSFAERGWL
jgi:DNA repair protein RadC